jgi:hypothetical protein
MAQIVTSLNGGDRTLGNWSAQIRGLPNEITPSRNIGPPLTPQGDQFSLLMLVVVRFSLISRCTHRAHAVFQVVERLKLSLQSIMGQFELMTANVAMPVVWKRRHGEGRVF